MWLFINTLNPSLLVKGAVPKIRDYVRSSILTNGAVWKNLKGTNIYFPWITSSVAEHISERLCILYL